jgi:inosose dehydratase
MAHVTVGIAPDSWGVWFADEPRQTPWRRYLDEVAELGFRHTELGPYGYMPTDRDQLAHELESRGLSLTAAVVMFDLEDPEALARSLDEVENVCSTLTALGGRHLVIIDDVYTDLFTGEPRLPTELDDDAWGRLVKTTTELCKRAEQHGLSGTFHPHAQCHVEYEWQIERLLEDVPTVGLCLDVGHHAYCGGDPVAFMERHADRIPYLHLKSVDGEFAAKVQKEGIPFATAVADGVFVEPSQGVVDFRRLHEVVEAAGYDGIATIEQDMYPTDFDRPLPIARRSKAFLSELGWS